MLVTTSLPIQSIPFQANPIRSDPFIPLTVAIASGPLVRNGSIFEGNGSQHLLPRLLSNSSFYFVESTATKRVQYFLRNSAEFSIFHTYVAFISCDTTGRSYAREHRSTAAGSNILRNIRFSTPSPWMTRITRLIPSFLIETPSFLKTVQFLVPVVA